MDYSEVEEGKVYLAVTEGQFIGVFFCIKKGEKRSSFISSYYAGDTVYEYLEKEDFDWPYEDEDLPDKSFAADMMPIKYYRWKDELSRYFYDILKHIFEEMP